MAHARLYFWDNELVVPVFNRPPLRLPVRQIRAWANFGSEQLMRQAVVDTGCPFCTPPKRTWGRLDDRGDIAWIANPPTAVPADQLTGTTVLLGGRYPLVLV